MDFSPPPVGAGVYPTNTERSDGAMYSRRDRRAPPPPPFPPEVDGYRGAGRDVGAIYEEEIGPRTKSYKRDRSDFVSYDRQRPDPAFHGRQRPDPVHVPDMFVQ